MVLYCQFTITDLQTLTVTFLTNLAMTDLGVGLTCLPLALRSTVCKGSLITDGFV